LVFIVVVIVPTNMIIGTIIMLVARDDLH